MRTKLIAFITLFSLLSAQVAYAVSVRELIVNCGDDGEAYCADAGYGDEMQNCLDENYAKLSAECKVIMDRLRGGEGVSLF